MDNKISLAIFGNQNSNSGFQPLYWINNPPEQLENLVPPGMDENPYFFTLQVLPSHTQYTLIQNRVSSYMSSRAGVLKMAIAIPKGYCISGGISPMQVLLQVREKFIETCMTLRDSHAEAYNFKEKLPPPDDFVNIVDSYHLAITPKPHLPMSGTEEALMLLDDEAIALLFTSPHHPEFHPIAPNREAQNASNDAWLDALGGVVKRVPVMDPEGVVIDHVLTPIIQGKIEGGAPDKVLYYRCPDDMLRGFRVYAGDLLLVVPASKAEDDRLMLVEYEGKRMVRKLLKLDGGRIQMQAFDHEFSAVVGNIQTVKVLGRCVRLTRSL
jgi:hypothetical protein